MNKLHFVLLMILATAGVTPAAVPTQVSFQGVLTNASGNPVADGSYGVVFRIYATDVTPVAL
ncbi:MAG TPA: hypothetical protein PKW75_12120, partial [candidate division Zixibacteria bacterium]|nr:hypothetical protein [candidate division Zixibacteria bacterium]